MNRDCSHCEYLIGKLSQLETANALIKNQQELIHLHEMVEENMNEQISLLKEQNKVLKNTISAQNHSDTIN